MEDLKLWVDDPWLEPWKKDIWNRHQSAAIRMAEMAGSGQRLADSANNHLYYCCHIEGDKRIFREWAPNATAIYLICDRNNWNKSPEYRFELLGEGNWELRLPATLLSHGDYYKWLIEWNGGEGERIPAYATRVVQDQETKIFTAQIWDNNGYKWKNSTPKKSATPLIYEAHIGMSTENYGVGTYSQFREKILPYIASTGYNAIQLMAIQEHPYYGSFGYQVSSFYAPSSRFGTPDELKLLIDEAHGMGIRVILDIVHSHAVNNTIEGLSEFDGTRDLYFHSGERGDHPSWGSRCFNYGKDQVISFLLSNCKYWIEEFRFDGFRFDGITSMLYFDHGLGKSFTDYSSYFSGNLDNDAFIYLAMANRVIKECNPEAVTIAEDVSGLPGLAAPFSSGGAGFDYRMSMGVADYWIKLIKERRDEDWNMGELYHELTSKRADEKTISYAECHDQAMVGDKTIIFRLLDAEMYTSMERSASSITLDRGIALHKMIRLITASSAGDGYLTFMGNEFGHPEWIDFPRSGNDWSYHYARRQWTLAFNPELKYAELLAFEKEMLKLLKKESFYTERPAIVMQHDERQLLAFIRGGYLFAYNFSPINSYPDLRINVPTGVYKHVLDTDMKLFGGFGRVEKGRTHFSLKDEETNFISLYLPSRCAIVLKKGR